MISNLLRVVNGNSNGAIYLQMWQDEADLPMLPPCGRCRSHVQLLGAIATQIHLTAECKKSVNIEFSFDIKELAFPAAMPCSAMIVSDLGKDDDSIAEVLKATLFMRKYSVHGCVTLFIFFKGLEVYFRTKFPCNLSPSRQKIVGCSFNLSSR